MTMELSRKDQRALGLAIQTYRRLSVKHADEVREMMRAGDGWAETARYCAIRCQQIEQGLSAEEVAPCEIRDDGMTLGEVRPEMMALLFRLQRNQLSRYEPSPERACDAAEQGRRDPIESVAGAAHRGGR